MTQDRAELTFDQLSIGDRIFDFDDQSFGTIVDKQSGEDVICFSDPTEQWRMIEVQWERDGNINDRSFILPGTLIGVQISKSHELYDEIMSEMSTAIEEIKEEHGQDEVILLWPATW